MKILRALILIIFPAITFAQVPKNLVQAQKEESNFLNDTVFEKDNSDPGMIRLTIHSPKGIVLSQGNMKADKKEGVWREYSPSGSLFMIEEFKGGKKNGMSIK